MKYTGIILTGTRFSGKSTIAHKLCSEYDNFKKVQAVTTREQRNDDRVEDYTYINEQEFLELKNNDKLLIETRYGEFYYGITFDALKNVLRSKKIPILILSPQSVNDSASKVKNCGYQFMTIFLDAHDNILDSRIIERNNSIVTNLDKIQRKSDRSYIKACIYNIKNIILDKTTQLIYDLWELRNSAGVIPHRLIELMIECGILLDNADINNIKSASYDLSLGDEYYYGGKLKELTTKKPFVVIEPYDYVIATCKEIANLPKDVTARFGLSVNLFCQGIILSNGPQVDPGFSGKLLCLLFNTSNKPVFLKRGQHYSTIEFHRLLEPSEAYSGQYQDKSIIEYIPANSLQGAINELKKDIEEIKREGKGLQNAFLGVISLILAILSLLLVIK